METTQEATKPTRMKRTAPANVEKELRDLAETTNAPGTRLGVFLTRMRTLACDAQEALDGIGDVNLAKVFGASETLPVKASLAIAISIQVANRPERRIAIVLHRDGDAEIVEDATAPLSRARVALEEISSGYHPGREPFEIADEALAEPRGIRIGDLVQYVGNGSSVLDGGPGRVIAMSGDDAQVEVITACTAHGNPVKPGEKFVLPLVDLAHS